jgi:hypothetical protein
MSIEGFVDKMLLHLLLLKPKNELITIWELKE